MVEQRLLGPRIARVLGRKLCVGARKSELRKQEKCRHIRDYTVSGTHPDGRTFPVKDDSHKSKQKPSKQRPEYGHEGFDGGIMTSFGATGLPTGIWEFPFVIENGIVTGGHCVGTVTDRDTPQAIAEVRAELCETLKQRMTEAGEEVPEILLAQETDQ